MQQGESGAGTKEPRPFLRLFWSAGPSQGWAEVAGQLLQQASPVGVWPLLTWTDQRGRGLTLPLLNKLRATKRGQKHKSPGPHRYHVTRPAHLCPPPPQDPATKGRGLTCSFQQNCHVTGQVLRPESNCLAGRRPLPPPSPRTEGWTEPSSGLPGEKSRRTPVRGPAPDLPR